MSLRDLIADVNGKLSSKRVAGFFLLINAVGLMWFSVVSGKTEMLGEIITLVAGSVGFLAPTVMEKAA
jgi:hypothetical protein